MKKILLLCLAVIGVMSVFAAEWVNIRSEQPGNGEFLLLSSENNISRLEFRMDGFFRSQVETERGPAWYIDAGKGAPSLTKGAPDLPRFATALVIPGEAHMDVRVISSSYVEFEDVLVAPSKGNLTREVDPATIPYSFGKQYERDAFYPAETAELEVPYIVRDVRGQALIIHPFRYNPVTGVLRVYYEMTLEVYEDGNATVNVLHQKGLHGDARFTQVYQRHFINYNNVHRYEPVGEEGSMLIISHADYLDGIEPLASWKNMRGIPCEVVDVDAIGGSADIKAFIQEKYDNENLAFVLLVGDADKVPTSQSMGNDSDVDYGYVAGDDHYPDLFVGRFSVETTTDIETMVTRTLNYEQDPSSDTAWYTQAIGIASQEGPGDDGEKDFEHIRNIGDTKLLPFTYSYTYEFFEGSQGGNDEDGNPSAQQVGAAVDSGATIINYTGHGSTTSWGTSGFSNYNVNNLSNTGRWPFIISVACVNGNFVGNTCFAEAWTRAEQGGQPTGAVATLMSTINQSWSPPMRGQDEMNSILTEAYEENVKRTFGGITMNGCMNMNDNYGQAGFTETDCWTIFGDPSLVVRTAVPVDLEVSHTPVLTIGETTLSVSCDVEGALAVLSGGGEILGKAVVTSGEAVIEYEALTEPGTLDLVVTAFNHRPYITTVDVIAADGPFLVVSLITLNDEAGNGNGMLDYAEAPVYLTIGLTNIGTEAAQEVTATLTGDIGYLTIDDSPAAYGNIPSGDTVYITDAFELTVSDSVPDLTQLDFELNVADMEGNIWQPEFQLVAHAPLFSMVEYTIDDEGGNDNQMLDPGETAQISILFQNSGSSAGFDVVGMLDPVSDYLLVLSQEQAVGDFEPGEQHMATFTVAAASDTPEGEFAELIFGWTAAHNLAGEMGLSVLVGKKAVLVIDLSGDSKSADSLADCFSMLQVNAEFGSVIPEELTRYRSVFVLLGVYPGNHILTPQEGTVLSDYLDGGGMLYMEGGDTWYFDDPTPVHPYFSIEGLDDGNTDLTEIAGVEDGFLSWFSFDYNGPNNYLDQIGPKEGANMLLVNVDPEFGVSVSHDGGNYRTVGSSFDFSGLTDNPGSSKEEMVAEILDFFGIGYTWTTIYSHARLNAEVVIAPNPASDHVTLRINLPRENRINVEVMDLSGQQVALLHEGIISAGSHSLSWDMKREDGAKIAPGAYLIHVRSGGESITQKLVVLR